MALAFTGMGSGPRGRAWLWAGFVCTCLSLRGLETRRSLVPLLPLGFGAVVMAMPCFPVFWAFSGSPRRVPPPEWDAALPPPAAAAPLPAVRELAAHTSVPTCLRLETSKLCFGGGGVCSNSFGQSGVVLADRLVPCCLCALSPQALCGGYCPRQPWLHNLAVSYHSMYSTQQCEGRQGWKQQGSQLENLG